MHWARITVTTSQEASEAVANCLFELNATGVELKDSDASTVNLIAYYPLDDRVGARMQRLRDFLAELPTWGIQSHPATIDLKPVKSENWEEAWKAAFLPRRVGKWILITPTWSDASHNETDVLIQLDPGYGIWDWTPSDHAGSPSNYWNTRLNHITTSPTSGPAPVS